MLKIGITGGIACGKSTVCRLFTFLGAPIYISDIQAHRLMLFDHKLRLALVDAFGEEVYDSDGAINKPFLSRLVFENESSRQLINSIVHPAVRKNFEQWAECQDADYVLFESALLFSSGSADLMDFTIVVHSPENERLQRLMQRDSISDLVAQQKIQAQVSQSELMIRAHALIRNGSQDLLMPQVQLVHRWLVNQNNDNGIVQCRCL